MARREASSRSRGLSRRLPRRAPKSRVLVVTEGTKTEPAYFTAFARVVGASTVEVTIVGTGNDPKTVVIRAIEERRRHRSSMAEDDSVWAVFDRDDHPRFNEAIQLARANGIGLAVSNPCFELWALFHYQDQSAHIHRADCQRRLAQHCPAYDPRRSKLFADEAAVAARHADAARRGAASLAAREQEGDPGGNPSTSVQLLTERIRSAAAG